MASAAAAWFASAAPKMFYLVHPKELALDDTDPKPKFFLLEGVPMFFVLIFVEWLIGTCRKSRTEGKYRLRDFVACTALGVAQYMGLIVVDMAVDALGLRVCDDTYRWVWEHWRLFDIPSKENVLLVYVISLIAKDLGYYWFHRTLHEFHLLWSAHSVHHSGEDCNVAMGLRQGILQPLFSWPFYLPAALLGIHPHTFAAHAQLNTLYMLWIHTDIVNRLPFGLEYVLNSPMAHRMHHRPPGNCNYGGLLIVWDRLFGTYQVEHVRKDLYGLAQQPPTFSPATLNTQHFGRMANIDGGRAGWLGRLVRRRVPARWVVRPSALWEPIPPSAGDEREEGAKRPKWQADAPPLGAVATLYLTLTLARVPRPKWPERGMAMVGGVLLLLKGGMAPAHKAASALTVLALLSLLCRVCDGKGAVGAVAAVSAPLLSVLGALVLA